MRIKPFNKLDSVFAIQDLLNKTMDVTSTLEPDAKISLDLRGLKYITPIGYTGLLSILEFLEKEYNVKVKVPNDDRPVKYMQRMNFFEVCSKNIKSQFDDQMYMESIYNRNRYNLETELMETKKATNYEDIEEINDSIKKILKNKGFRGARLSNIQTFITELGNNVIDHTETPCFISVKSNNEDREMEIAVTDNGDGIYESLKDTLRGLTTDEVVRAAIMTKASRLEQDDRGNGLLDVKQKAFHPSNEVILDLCTNNTVYRVSKKDVQSLNKGSKSFGTFFQLKIKYPLDNS
ncbi:ATP-binding protein [Fredinandcohnia sp. QZ13]|uniref:ATP-binding protein n=1 Tax=Fredinandcohnia sp. QZ13 TaxID=3073144 RepID=UPI002853012A|nr:ATP-binding protein [Fredinandcohnia sp. QZ13]MDR4888370.1 ATP-binding protein [Fredinandcohnia sp. QZ13]